MKNGQDFLMYFSNYWKTIIFFTPSSKTWAITLKALAFSSQNFILYLLYYIKLRKPQFIQELRKLTIIILHSIDKWMFLRLILKDLFSNLNKKVKRSKLFAFKDPWLPLWKKSKQKLITHRAFKWMGSTKFISKFPLITKMQMKIYKSIISTTSLSCHSSKRKPENHLDLHSSTNQKWLFYNIINQQTKEIHITSTWDKSCPRQKKSELKG